MRIELRFTTGAATDATARPTLTNGNLVILYYFVTCAIRKLNFTLKSAKQHQKKLLSKASLNLTILLLQAAENGMKNFYPWFYD